MESFLKRRLVEEEQLQTEIQDSFSELNKSANNYIVHVTCTRECTYMYISLTHRLSEDKTLFNLDLTVQLLLKQGQVEIEEGDFIPDYSESVLIHRKVIEELNKEIKVNTYTMRT